MIDEATKADPFFEWGGVGYFFVQSFFSKITMIDVVFLVQMHVYSFNSMLDFFVPRNFLFEIT